MTPKEALEFIYYIAKQDWDDGTPTGRVLDEFNELIVKALTKLEKKDKLLELYREWIKFQNLDICEYTEKSLSYINTIEEQIQALEEELK